jgi:hypothetical protein
MPDYEVSGSNDSLTFGGGTGFGPTSAQGWIEFQLDGANTFIRRAQAFEKAEDKVSAETIKKAAELFAERAQQLSPFWTGLLSQKHFGKLAQEAQGPQSWNVGIVSIHPAMHTIIPELTTVYGPRIHAERPWFAQTIDQYADSIMSQVGARIVGPYLSLFGGGGAGSVMDDTAYDAAIERERADTTGWGYG